MKELELIETWFKSPQHTFRVIFNQVEINNETSILDQDSNPNTLFLKVLSLLYNKDFTGDDLIMLVKARYPHGKPQVKSLASITRSKIQQLVDKKLLPTNIVLQFDKDLEQAKHLPGCPKCNQKSVLQKYQHIIDKYKDKIEEETSTQQLESFVYTLDVLLDSLSLMHIVNMLPMSWARWDQKAKELYTTNSQLISYILTSASLRSWSSVNLQLPFDIESQLTYYNFSVSDYVQTLIFIAVYKNDNIAINQIAKDLKITFFPTDCLEEEWE